jgi:hypothetical protein
MRLLLACVAICLSWVAPECVAASNYWSRIGPFGGDVSALQFDTADPSCALAHSNAEAIQ